MDKKIILFAILFSLLLGGLALAAEPAKRALEITYPEIPGVPTPKDVTVGLPNYVNYLFRFSIIFFGLLILGVLILNGFNYLLSFGNPTKLSDARQGIVAALLGGLILFSAYILFNAINPKLVTLELPPATVVKAMVVPGVYVCSYQVANIEQLLSQYTANDCNVTTDEQRKSRNEAAKELRGAMGDSDHPKTACFLVNYSSRFTNFVLSPRGRQTIFIIPEEKYNLETNKFSCEYNHGIVLHETDKFTGKCRLYPRPPVSGTGSIYRQIDNFQADMEFVAKAITIFQKPARDPIPEALGVTLYEGLGFNEIGWEEEKKEGEKLPNNAVCKEDKDCASNNCVPDNPARPDLTRRCQATRGGFLPSSLSAWIAKVLAAEDPNYLKRSFKTGGADVLIVNEETLKEKIKAGSREVALYHNTRSIRIEPKNGYLAILYGDALNGKGKDDNTKGEANEKCEVRKTDDANLMDDAIGRCGTCGIVGWATNWTGLTKCYPCLEYMIVVKGQTL